MDSLHNCLECFSYQQEKNRGEKKLVVREKNEILDKGRTDRLSRACSEEEEEGERGAENESSVTNGCWWGKGKRLDVESEHSWSSMWSLTHGYTRWWVERARAAGAFTLPPAVSEVMLFKKWLHWKEPAAAARWGNFNVTTSTFCMTYWKPSLSSLNMQNCTEKVHR